MNSSNKALYPLIGSLLVAVGIFLGIFLTDGKTSSSSSSIEGKYEQKLADIIQVLDREYVDTIDKKQLFEKTISDLLHGLDPHSNYIAAEDLAAMSESIQGKFGGVGIRFTIYDDTLSVVNVIDQSPAFKVGIQKFDQIINVDGEDIANVGLSNEHVRELLKGEEGTPVNITILRKGEKLNKKVIRGAVPIESISASYMLTDDIGYIRLGQFSMQSANEFYVAAIALKGQGMKKMVFDLRYNGGGVLGSAVSILDAILEKGTPIVSTKGKNNPERIIYSESKPFLGHVDMAVLINSSSASASEIVAGAIQDNDRGTIIGRRSFGKGLVQQDIQLKDGSNLRLTVSRYYTPTGRSIQKPYMENYEDYMMDELNRYENGELYELDSSLLADSLKYTTPKGKIVYGGGGIMPDIFVPLDTTGSSMYYRRLQYANVFNEFSYHYARFNDLTKYRNVQAFDREFKLTEKILNDFKKYAADKHDIAFNEREYQLSLERIKTSVKAEIARQRWLELGAYYIFNKNDNEINTAIKALQ
ncbi:S41 family peptidase [Brumimicrobium glaciale]|uniref:S41 family peptidase n=1 Tax=Brumimicrobium glaciale TaxID=200475 RepID=A0A4Q4KL85_9FLAO|nr:S41 family peptidase [Brumimicrobium glaciale]RYM34153.1 S41 family peptidase [Brumimicrobium glaciale]